MTIAFAELVISEGQHALATYVILRKIVRYRKHQKPGGESITARGRLTNPPHTRKDSLDMSIASERDR